MQEAEKIYNAIKNRRIKEALKLIETISDGNSPEYNMAMWSACRWCDMEVIRALIKKDVDINFIKPASPLLVSARDCCFEIVELLIENGAIVTEEVIRGLNCTLSVSASSSDKPNLTIMKERLQNLLINLIIIHILLHKRLMEI